MFKNAKQTEWITIHKDRYPSVRRYANALLATAITLYLAAWLIHSLALPSLPAFVAILAVYIAAVIPLMYTARQKLGLKRTQQPALPQPLGLQFHTGMNGASFLAPQAAVSVMFPGSMGTAWLIAAPIAALGYTLVSFSAMTREPTAPACPDCSYPVDGLTFPALCSECARPLPNPSAATTVIQRKRPIHIAIGTTCLVAAVLILAGSLFRPAILTRNLPFTARLALAASDESAFNTIDTTKLTPDQRSDLVDNILDARLRAARTNDFVMQNDQLSWIAGELIAGTLTQDQAHRLIAEGFELSIIARPVEGDTIRVGQPFELSLFAKIPDRGVGAYSVPIFFAGFVINGKPPIGASTADLRAYTLTRSFARRDTMARDYPTLIEGDETPVLIITPEDTTPLHIRARLVIAFDANRTNFSIAWNPDGSHTLSPVPPVDVTIGAETTITPAPADP